MIRIIFSFLQTIFIVCFSNISFSSDATFCKILENEIKKNQIDLRLDLQPETYAWGADYGIDLDLDSNFKYIRNNDGSIRVFNVRKQNSIYEDFQSYELIHPNANIPIWLLYITIIFQYFIILAFILKQFVISAVLIFAIGSGLTIIAFPICVRVINSNVQIKL